VSPGLDPSCIRFDDPNAVVNGEIVYAGFTAYELGLDHACRRLVSRPRLSPSPCAKQSLPAIQCPEEANLIYRDAMIPVRRSRG
jgi:hypothetical protein